MSIRLSKAMSRVLRHDPPPSMDSSGWVTVPALMRHLNMQVTEKDVREVVESSDKKRFVLDDSAVPARIRAAQGHSVQLEAPVLEAVPTADSVPLAIHVTSSEGWAAIQESGELRRMERTHIHFATVAHHMRSNKWANVLLRLDLQGAIAAGHQFYLSTNQVLLCEGPLSASYVTKVALEALPRDWQEALQSRGGPQPPASTRNSGAQRHGRERTNAPPPPPTAPTAPSDAPITAAAAASAALSNLSSRAVPWPAAVAQGQGPAAGTAGPSTPASTQQASPLGAHAPSAKDASHTSQPAQHNARRPEPRAQPRPSAGGPTWGTMGAGQHSGSRKIAKHAAAEEPKEDWPTLGGTK